VELGILILRSILFSNFSFTSLNPAQTNSSGFVAGVKRNGFVFNLYVALKSAIFLLFFLDVAVLILFLIFEYEFILLFLRQLIKDKAITHFYFVVHIKFIFGVISCLRGCNPIWGERFKNFKTIFN